MDSREKKQLAILVKTLHDALEQLYLSCLKNEDIEAMAAAKKVADDCIRDIYDLVSIQDCPAQGKKSNRTKRQNFIHLPPDYIRLKKVCIKCGRVFMPRKNFKSQICWKCRRKKSL